MDQGADDEGDHDDSDATQEEEKRCDDLSQPEPVEDGDAEQQPNLPDTDGPKAGKKKKNDGKTGKGGKGNKKGSEFSPASTRSQTAVRVSPWTR